MATANEIEIRVTVDDKTRAPFQKIENKLKADGKRAGDSAGQAAGKAFSGGFTKTSQLGTPGGGAGGPFAVFSRAAQAAAADAGKKASESFSKAFGDDARFNLKGSGGMFAGLLSGAAQAGRNAGKEFGDGFGQGFNGGGGKGGGLGGFVSGGIMGGIKSLGSAFTGLFQLITSGFANSATSASEALGKMGGGIAGVLVSVAQLGALLAAIGAIAGPAVIGIGTLVAAVGGSLVVALGAGVAALGLFNVKAREAFTALGEEIQNSLARLTDSSGLTAAFQRMADVFRTTFRNLRTEIKTAMVTVQPLLDDLAAGLAQFANTLMPRVVTAVALAGPVFEGFRDMLGQLGVGLGEMFIELTKHAEGFKGFFQGLGEVFRQVLPSLGDFAGILAQELGPALRLIAPALKDMVDRLGPLLAKAIEDLAPKMPGLIDGFTRVAEAIGPLLPPLTDMAVRLLPSLALAIERLTPAIEFVAGVFTDVLLPVFDVVTATLGLVIATFEAAALAAQGRFTEAKDVLVAAGQELATSLGQSSQQGGQAFSTNLRNGVQDAREGVQTGTQNILSGILGFQGRFESGGAALGEAFRRGIIAKINAAVAAVQAAVRTIAASLPGSPAKEGPLSGRGYTKLRGQRMMTDFAKGIKKNARQVKLTAADAMGNMAFSVFGSKDKRGRRGPLATGSISTGIGAYKGAGAPSASMLRDNYKRQNKAAFWGLANGTAQVTVNGDADGAVATMIQKLIRTGKLRVSI